jgi:hypothetical protein
MLLQSIGVLIQAAGILILYLHWRRRRGSHGAFLVSGWALMALGAAPWFLSASPERALAIGMLPPMLAGLLLLAPDALPRIAAKTAIKKTKVVAGADEPVSPAPGSAARNAGRWFAVLIAAPSLGLSAATIWQIIYPGGVADRTVFSSLVLIAVWIAALLWLLASDRPWRAGLAVCAAATLLGVGAILHLFQGPL